MTHNIDQIGINAKKAARVLAKTSTEQKIMLCKQWQITYLLTKKLF